MRLKNRGQQQPMDAKGQTKPRVGGGKLRPWLLSLAIASAAINMAQGLAVLMAQFGSLVVVGLLLLVGLGFAGWFMPVHLIRAALEFIGRVLREILVRVLGMMGAYLLLDWLGWMPSIGWPQ